MQKSENWKINIIWLFTGCQQSGSVSAALGQWGRYVHCLLRIRGLGFMLFCNLWAARIFSGWLCCANTGLRCITPNINWTNLVRRCIFGEDTNYSTLYTDVMITVTVGQKPYENNIIERCSGRLFRGSVWNVLVIFSVTQRQRWALGEITAVTKALYIFQRGRRFLKGYTGHMTESGWAQLPKNVLHKTWI